jgi:hypothetical protein
VSEAATNHRHFTSRLDLTKRALKPIYANDVSRDDSPEGASSFHTARYVEHPESAVVGGDLRFDCRHGVRLDQWCCRDSRVGPGQFGIFLE